MLGTGIIKGLAETARNFVGSYHDPERLVTVEYPEEKLPPKENARNFPFLVFDGNDSHAGLRCVACQICEKECPPKCIYIVKSKDKKPDYVGKPQLYPATLRHRHLGVHELPDLRRGLPVRGDQDGHRIRA
jgi:NADH-quinone oxidoreductase subunit I